MKRFSIASNTSMMIVHRKMLLPSGCPLTRSSKKPKGMPIHTGHKLGWSKRQLMKIISPKGGMVGDLAMTGSIAGSAEKNSTDRIGTPFTRNGDCR